MLQMFEDAEAGRTIQRPQRKVNDEYDVIMNNILMMFLNNTYLNIQLKEKQYRQQNAELTALQLQINPHFLYNTLQTLDMEARKLNDDGRISAVVGYVSDILKYSLTNPQKSVSLREELDYLKKYVEVQHYRFGDSFIIYYEVDDDVMDAEVFRLMLQPVVENSLLHALRGNERGYMKVRARRIGDKVNLRVIDNGDGMTREELEALRKRIADRNSRSIGLTNLDRRLRLRGFFYPGRFQKLLSGFLLRRLMLFYRTASCADAQKATYPNCNQNHRHDTIRNQLISASAPSSVFSVRLFF